MDPLKRFYERVPVWKQLYYKWRSLRGVPLRRKFFVGYDLDANTYWEFYIDGIKPNKRPRRIVQPFQSEELLYNYFDKVPIQWAQWLKFTRRVAPSIFEILKDNKRVRNLQTLAQFRDSEQKYNRELKDAKIEHNLQKELHKLDQQEQNHANNAANLMSRTGFNISSEPVEKEQPKSNLKPSRR